MSRQPYRSELGMILDVLQVAKECGRQGTIITTIARRANLSHYAATDKCQKLIDFGLMKARPDKRSNFFIITEKGIQFYEELQRFTETIQAIRVRY
ncbi:MAG: transcriptional regulator [Thaumarchaeota archaeon]|nr:transcriptional regulator [Nitrososphaerota archaeon]MDE1831686.1 transcriptional regulator [Nitrososphaerota archaeon]MDE1840362.1 transcriptional regulator [Nitrososphaerota archaeon]MDE1878034.1 transcriptional regulator [Nitrososphaerota archaeon]